MRDIREILENLNEEQISPVLETEGAVLVLAGAGSGKTRVLTSRIAYLIEEKKVPPEGILAITFTNKAANEMKERSSQITDPSGMWVCTIHSMCVRILRMFSDEAGLKKNFSIYSETERLNIIKKVFQELDFDDEKLLKDAKYHVANAKMLGLTPDEYEREYAGESRLDEIIKIYRGYNRHLKDNNSLDFDDLLNETRLLLKRNEEVREYLSGRFRYILVDEFQDTNEVQYEIIRLLASAHKNLFAVGDDDQSIYGWRGAKIENILHFEKDFKDTKVFKLERNYRSTKNILDVANEIIKGNSRRKEKTLWTKNDEGEIPEVYEGEEESGEARFVAHTIAGLMRKGWKFSDFAILMRLNALTRSFEQEFMADGIPFKVFGGFKFYERKEIKDMLAYLRLISNPFDSEALVRIINVPNRGIGQTTVAKLEEYAFDTGLSVYDSLLELEEIGFTGKTKERLEGFAKQLTSWIYSGISMPVNELVKKIIADTKIKESYEGDSDEAINKRANIDEFVNSVEEYCKLNPNSDLADYLQQVSLSSDTDDINDGNYVTLATIHSVKGLEFRGVFVCGMEENIMPISRASSREEDLEEERRLMYVAITRAKERLYFTRSKSRYLYGKREPTLRSPYLKELSNKIKLPQEERQGYNRLRADDYGYPRYGSSSYAGRGSSYGGYSSGGSSYGGYANRSYEGSNIRFGGGKEEGFTFGSSASKPKIPTKTKDLSAFKTGVKVVHPKFGEGIIVGRRGMDSNLILDVAFTGFGIKQLSASLAPLTIKN